MSKTHHKYTSNRNNNNEQNAVLMCAALVELNKVKKIETKI